MLLHFNPRPLAGATEVERAEWADGEISIHAPLRGRLDELKKLEAFYEFQSTPPCGGDCRLAQKV